MFKLIIIYFISLICSGPPHFEDNQKLAWDAKLVADTLVTYIQKFKINCVIINLILFVEFEITFGTHFFKFIS